VNDASLQVKSGETTTKVKDDTVEQMAQKQREADEAMKDITAAMRVCII